MVELTPPTATGTLMFLSKDRYAWNSQGADWRTHTLTRVCVHSTDTPLLVNGNISEGVLLTEQLQLPKITTVTSPGCLIMVAWIKAAISYVIFGETGYSVKHQGWGWPHMLRLHAGSCRCHNISAGFLSWRDEDILLPWGNNPVNPVYHLNMLFFLLCYLLLSCAFFLPQFLSLLRALCWMCHVSQQRTQMQRSQHSKGRQTVGRQRKVLGKYWWIQNWGETRKLSGTGQQVSRK